MRKSVTLSLSALLYAALISLAQPVIAQQTSREVDAPELAGIDLRSLINIVSARTGKNFIVDPRVNATVTVIAAEPVAADKLYELFLSVLAVHGYAAVPAGAFIKIQPTAAALQSGVPVVEAPGDTGHADALVTEVIHVIHVPSRQLADALRPLLPASATLAAEVHSNAVVITDRADNIARIRAIIRQLDKPG
jgi:general secretion pathway protein D